MNNSLPSHIRQLILNHSLLTSEDKILIAVSGGADSVVLLDCLFHLKDELGFKLAIAHYNYCLRGAESDGDEEFVCSLANKYDVALFCEKKSLHHIESGIQEQARNLRYAFFERIASEYSFTKIATGHTASDNAETVLFNFLRGTGVRGLVGIPLKRGGTNIIRPLLKTTREEIERYAHIHSLEYRTDSSNAKNKYTRNIVRNEILPLIRATVNPNVQQALERTSSLFSDLEDFLRVEYDKMKALVCIRKGADEAIFNIPALLLQPKFLQEYFLYTFLSEYIEREVNYKLVEQILHLAKSETGKLLNYSENITVFNDREQLIIKRKLNEHGFRFSVDLNKEYRNNEFSFRAELLNDREVITNNTEHTIEFVDADILGNELIVRSWNAGDYFFPLGMNGKKKISDFFIDEKVPRFEKNNIPILESSSHIVWVCGKRLDDRFKVTGSTKHIVKLEFTTLRTN